MCDGCSAWYDDTDYDYDYEDDDMIGKDTIDSFDTQEEFSTAEVYGDWLLGNREDYVFDGWVPLFQGMEWVLVSTNEDYTRISIQPKEGVLMGYLTVEEQRVLWKKEAPIPPRRFTEEDFPVGSVIKHRHLDGLFYLHLVNGWYHLDVRQPDGFRSPRQLSKRAWPQVLEYFTTPDQTAMHADWEKVSEVSA